MQEQYSTHSIQDVPHFAAPQEYTSLQATPQTAWNDPIENTGTEIAVRKYSDGQLESPKLLQEVGVKLSSKISGPQIS